MRRIMHTPSRVTRALVSALWTRSGGGPPPGVCPFAARRGPGTVAPMTGEAGVVSDGPMFFGRDGQPLSMAAWIDRHKDSQYRFLGRERVGDLEVITAWLGTDQGEEDTPLIFGTIVYDHAADTFDNAREEFTATEAAALDAHARHLARVCGSA